METEIKYWKFSTTAVETPPMKEEYLTEPKDFLAHKFANRHDFGTFELATTGMYKLLGWVYDFRPVMKKYVVKQHGNWREYFAPNRTLIRKYAYGRVDKILEVK
jgi:hypothetical protein